ncbi:hypothetical protein [Streptomyces virginiae]|uniref:hypothetical protein n=1 Tax=Streptomyces virginiae TaxID=1961 RepID=UPI0007C4D633|nr:hypothetical protein [Streptomyces virginiae]
MTRFRAQPLTQISIALDTLLNAHLAVEDAGYVAVEYDGCMLYDFDQQRMMLCDLDEYRPGPFTLEADRLPGSSRYMAPEEFVRGSLIDIRTTVFNLGRALRLLLDAGDEETQWRGTPAQLAVIMQATAPSPLSTNPDDSSPGAGRSRPASRHCRCQPHGLPQARQGTRSGQARAPRALITTKGPQPGLLAD